MENKTKYPLGFHSFGRNIGIKNNSLDFAVIYSEVLCDATAVFTQNNFPGAPIIVGREHVAGGKLQAIVINSKNSNVATGNEGIENARKMCEGVAKSLGISTEHVLPSSTGVIGVPLPMQKIYPACLEAKQYLKTGNLDEVAVAIMTTDTKKKVSVRTVKTNKGTGTIFGMAKGAGMIEPNMATMLCYILSDVKVSGVNLYDILKASVDKTFNCMSIDSDTSTSDTVALLCSGLAGEAETNDFIEALQEICADLTKQIVADGEGVSKIMVVDVNSAKDETQATKIGKSIINSPLIKTALRGGDPNWGRLVMAVGKVFSEKIPYETLQIYMGEINVKGADSDTLKRLSSFLKSNFEIPIRVELNTGTYSKRFWGCDLTEDYVKENAYYTT